MPTVNERCKILPSLNRVYVFEIVLLLVPRLKILRRRGLSYFGIFEKQEAQSSSQETNHNNGLGGLTWVWLGCVWAWYLAPFLPSFAAAAAPCGRPGKAP